MKGFITVLIGVVLFCATPIAHAARYALLAGINEYSPTYVSSPLFSCVNDATGMRRCLTSDSSRWSANKITTLLNSAANKTAIRNKLHTLASTAVSGDLVVYFQSSHGGQHSGTDTYLCTYDADYEDEELAADLALFATGVKVIVVIDACYSGGLFKGADGTAPVKPIWNFSENVMRHYDVSLKTHQIKGASIGWITACDFDELSWEGTCYGLFTGYMIYGFAYGDTNTNGMISFQELFDYAAPKALLTNPGQTAQTYNSSVLTSTEATAAVPVDSALQNAIDQSVLSAYSAPGPGALWFRQTRTTYDGIDAAQSGNIGNGEASEFGTRVVGPGTLTYCWRTSSEAGYDFLLFQIDDNVMAELSGISSSWVQQTHQVGPGEHLLHWIYLKDDLYSEGSDCGWVDQVTWTPATGTGSSQVPNAIDALLLPVKTGGNTSWFRETSTTFDGVDAAQSGTCADAQCSWFTTELIGPGDLSFRWRVSSEEGYDLLEFSTDETVHSRISGNTSWQNQSLTLGTGVHTVGWCYLKDYAMGDGSDCGWVDQVVWTGDCDTDGDGLPTSWEIACGLNYTNATGANGPDGNPDNDNQNNLQEYIAGTNPTNGSSFFQITNPLPQTDPAAGFVIQWPSVTGRTYRVLWAPTLTNDFQQIGYAIPYPANSYTDTVHGVENKGYYRINVQLQ